MLGLVLYLLNFWLVWVGDFGLGWIWCLGGDFGGLVFGFLVGVCWLLCCGFSGLGLLIVADVLFLFRFGG